METKFLDAFSQEVWQTTYKHHSDSNVNDTLKRVARAAASAEKGECAQEHWEKNFYELLTDFKMCAGGRILANAGTDWRGTTLMNCFVGPKPKYDQDSLEGIFHVLLQQAQTLKSEGGWGMNFSFIRPRGSFIHGIGVETPGAVKYMEIFDKSSDVITAGSGKKKKTTTGKTKIRKGAMMGVLDVWHPDVLEFITAKLPYLDSEGKEVKRLQKFNISVNCSNEFMDKVTKIVQLKQLIKQEGEYDLSLELERYTRLLEEEDKWDLIFPDTQFPKYKAEWDGNMALWKSKGYPFKVFSTVKVTDLWELIMSSTFERNDPGVLFLDQANASHCWSYAGIAAYIAATNPCGEQCLPFGAVCNLASMNLTRFVREDGTFDFEKFIQYVRWSVRFLDNINDITNAPLPEYEQSIRERRRIGLGVMGWGSMLYMMRIRFASKKAEALKHQIMEALTHTAVETSIELAKEKGMFIGCDPLKHSSHPFFKKIGISENQLDRMAQYGIRNSALFSCQPTGNTGILCNVVSGGIEPVFLPEYIRTVIVDGCPEELLPWTPKYWEGEFKETKVFRWVKEGNDDILKGEVHGITYKIDKNRGLTKEVLCQDYGVRWLNQRGLWDAKAEWAVTASSLTVEDHVADLTGFAHWIDSSLSKTVNLPNDYKYDDFKNLYVQAYSKGLKGITTYRAGTMMNVLSAKQENTAIPKTKAPKRPEALKGELHHFLIDKHKYYVAVGLFGDEPYEIFTGINETKKEIYIPKNVKTGTITKQKRGEYVFTGDDNETYKLTNGHSDETSAALSRMVSCALRHGSDIAFIVHQLEKTEGPIVSFSKSLARTLKKYIKDGTEVKGEECPECKGKLTRQEGCCTCSSCGYSKCS